MTLIGLLRHAPTEWSEAGRIQGRTDIALSERGRAEAGAMRLPGAILGRAIGEFEFCSSPLARARETAAILFPTEFRVDRRLSEMDWGEWEGARLAELRNRQGEAMRENESRGLDFRPPQGESPREVQLRIGEFLRARLRPCLAVTHKGVIRAALSLATGWDMRDKSPVRLAAGRVLLFESTPEGVLRLVTADLALRQS
jgi:broad specificity phosphatase PhoE